MKRKNIKKINSKELLRLSNLVLNRDKTLFDELSRC